MIKEFTKTQDGTIVDPVSSYNPSEKVKDVTAVIVNDYTRAVEEQGKPRNEFNGRNLIVEIDQNQKRFNSYIPPRSDDPDESWRAQTVRPLTRNKLISIAAHVTANILYPNVFAQNDKQEEDKSMSLVFRDLIEFHINNSNYSKSFLQAVITMLVDPACIIESSFSEVTRKIKEITGPGKWIEKTIIDDVLSGFAANVVPAKNLLIPNFSEPDIQKQRFLIKHKYIDFADAKIIYGGSENFQYVQPGTRCVFDTQTKLFYDVQDDELRNYLVSEDIYYNRSADLQLTFINGILVSHEEQPLKRIDKKYPFAKSGYEPLNNGQFFYYKSAANKLGSDQEIVDNLYNMIMDGSYMQLMPPLAVYGSEDVNTSIMIPGTTTAFRDPNVKIDNIGPRSDIRAGLEALGLVEKSMSESSQDSLLMGISGGGQRTARESILLQQNAKTALGLFGKQIAFLVEDLGNLMLGDILQYQTVASLDEITGDLAYKSFLIPNKVMDGKKVTHKVKFSSKMLGSETLNEEDLNSKSYDLLKDEGGIDSEMRISEVNPELVRNYKYKVVVSADELTPKSKAIDKALNLELYDRAIQNPTVDQNAVTRDFLFEVFKPGESDKYMSKNTQPGVNPQPGGLQQKGVSTSMLSQLTGSNSLGIAANSDLEQ